MLLNTMSKIHSKSVTNRRPPARTRARGRRPEFLSVRIPARSTTAKPRRPTTIELHWALPSKPQICNLSCSLQTAPCWLMQTSPRPKNVDCQCHPPGFLRPATSLKAPRQGAVLNCFPQFLFWKRLLDRVSNATTKPGHHWIWLDEGSRGFVSYLFWGTKLEAANPCMAKWTDGLEECKAKDN